MARRVLPEITAPAPPAVYKQTHEYIVDTYDLTTPSAQEIINAHAAQGWRLIAVTGVGIGALYFEREVR